MARSRTTDPSTSHEAGHNIETDGLAATLRQACLTRILDYPGMTAGEVSYACGMEHGVAHRRLPELEEMGLVETGDARICEIRGTRMQTWWPMGYHEKYKQPEVDDDGIIKAFE